MISNGPVKAVGICNFSVRQLKQLLDYCAQNDLPKPAVLQNECHPYLTAKPVRDLCKVGVFEAAKLLHKTCICLVLM